jgi:vacuolar-type H+-ATPase subunit F/Vma7
MKKTHMHATVAKKSKEDAYAIIIINNNDIKHLTKRTYTLQSQKRKERGKTTEKGRQG